MKAAPGACVIVHRKPVKLLYRKEVTPDFEVWRGELLFMEDAPVADFFIAPGEDLKPIHTQQ